MSASCLMFTWGPSISIYWITEEVNQMPSPLYVLCHLILTIPLHSRRGKPHYTGVETEAQKQEIPCPRFPSWWNLSRKSPSLVPHSPFLHLSCLSTHAHIRCLSSALQCLWGSQSTQQDQSLETSIISFAETDKVIWRREWLPTPVFLPGEFHGQRNQAAYTVHGVPKSPWDPKERWTLTQLQDHELSGLKPEKGG